MTEVYRELVASLTGLIFAVLVVAVFIYLIRLPRIPRCPVCRGDLREDPYCYRHTIVYVCDRCGSSFEKLRKDVL